MKKNTLMIGLVAILVFATSLVTMGMAYADSPTPDAPQGAPAGGPDGVRGGMMGGFMGGPEGTDMGKYTTQAWAKLLGVTEEEFKASQEKGTSVIDIAVDNGWKSDVLKTKMEEVRNSAIDLALADKAITQAQADEMKKGPGKKDDASTPSEPKTNPLQDLMTAASAEIYGMTAEEYQAAFKEGKSDLDLAADKDMTVKDYLAKTKAARESALKAAVEKGLITQSQADEMLKRGGMGGGMMMNGFRAGAGKAGEKSADKPADKPTQTSK